MAGYTRQEAANIITSNVIEASYHNNELNAIEAAFHASTGHSHDGTTTGEGPKISLTGSVTGTLPVANGGTNATTASAARTSLGLVIGTDVQTQDAGLDDIAALAVTNGNFIVGDGTNWVAESGATARTSLDVPSNSEALLAANNLSDLASASTARTNLGVSASGDVLAVANNLSDLASASTARTNLGVPGTGDASVSWAGKHSYTDTISTNTDLIDITSTLAGSNPNVIDINVSGSPSNPNIMDIDVGSIGLWGGSGGGLFNFNSTYDGATFGPLMTFHWNSSSPAASDYASIIRVYFEDSASNADEVGNIKYVWDDPTSTSEDGHWLFETIVAGTLDTDAMKVGNGVTLGAPTGGFQGAGTLNATGVYDDSSLLTDYVSDYYNGTLTAERQEFYDSLWKGVGESPARTFETERAEVSLDIDAFVDTFVETGSLPAMPTREEWMDSPFSMGDMVNRLWETIEVLTLHIKELNERTK